MGNSLLSTTLSHFEAVELAPIDSLSHEHRQLGTVTQLEFIKWLLMSIELIKAVKRALNNLHLLGSC